MHPLSSRQGTPPQQPVSSPSVLFSSHPAAFFPPSLYLPLLSSLSPGLCRSIFLSLQFRCPQSAGARVAVKWRNGPQIAQHTHSQTHAGVGVDWVIVRSLHWMKMRWDGGNNNLCKPLDGYKRKTEHSPGTCTILDWFIYIFSLSQ